MHDQDLLIIGIIAVGAIYLIWGKDPTQGGPKMVTGGTLLRDALYRDVWCKKNPKKDEAFNRQVCLKRPTQTEYSGYCIPPPPPFPQPESYYQHPNINNVVPRRTDAQIKKDLIKLENSTKSDNVFSRMFGSGIK
jgi:hypothetical protein